ncbi:MAG: carboxypeptidase-like regulatory domain-containing protein, partial [Muribaculaceae bacterium]
MKKRIVLFLFSAVCCLSPAMAGRFETVIVDVERQPVAGAVVSFYALPDSALVDAVTADAAGRVTFANANAMALRAQAIGFLPLVAATDAVGDTLVLARPTNQLRELVVSAQPVMQRSAGQFTYLPNDLRSKTDNSFELLRLVPLLDVSDRGISIFGKGASRIFING